MRRLAALRSALERVWDAGGQQGHAPLSVSLALFRGVIGGTKMNQNESSLGQKKKLQCKFLFYVSVHACCAANLASAAGARGCGPTRMDLTI